MIENSHNYLEKLIVNIYTIPEKIFTNSIFLIIVQKPGLGISSVLACLALGRLIFHLGFPSSVRFSGMQWCWVQLQVNCINFKEAPKILNPCRLDVLNTSVSMPPKREKNDAPVVAIDCSDDENGAVPGTSNAASNKTPSQARPHSQQQNNPKPSAVSSVPSSLECRSFWKAGDYVVGPTAKPPPLQGYLEHARVHPKFLHSNATSHKWAFGGIL